MNHDGLLLLAKILASPEPPKGRVAILSATREGLEERAARHERARQLAHRPIGIMDAFMFYGANTRAEALHAREMYEHDSDVIIVTSAYHQLRAFLTYVKAFEGTTVRLWNAPAPSHFEKLEAELGKIAEYQAKGHVASYAEGLAHLASRA